MRSQIRFAMHPDDEREFVAHVLGDESVVFIDGPRWESESPLSCRDIAKLTGTYCIVWSPRDLQKLTAKYVPTCKDWYCDSEYATIQFLRSELLENSVIIEGRIAVSTEIEFTPKFSEASAKQVEARFKMLRRFIKTNYSNSIIRWKSANAPIAPAGPQRSANPSKPDPQIWIGPAALAWMKHRKTRCIKQFRNGFVEGRLSAE